MAIFEELYEQGNTIILVTHERYIAEHSRRIVHLRDGLIETDEVIPEESRRVVTNHENAQL